MKALDTITAKFKNLPSAVAKKFRAIPSELAGKFAGAKEILTQGNGKVTASMLVMGLGQLIYRQWIKGFMYLFVQAAFIVYFVLTGAGDLFGLFTLGTREGNAWYGVEGDNSVVMLITGILSVFIIFLYIMLYISNVKDEIGRASCRERV